MQGSGCTARTVRYYEQVGLLVASRTSGGHRQFEGPQLDRLIFIVNLREAGWSLREVVSFLDAREQARTDADACDQLQALVDEHVARLDRKLEVLSALRQDLRDTGALLPVCQQCVAARPRIDCQACDRLPALPELPRAFRLLWRSRTGTATPPFDESAADQDAD